MKTPTVLVSLLALAGTAATAESADAAISGIELPENLRDAICYQNWYEAIELSGQLITSSKITPEHRQTLLELRRNLYTYAKSAKATPDELIDCQESQIESVVSEQPQLFYEGPVPQFSKGISNTPGRYCYQKRTSGDFDSLNYQCPNKETASIDTKTTVLSQHRVNTPNSVWAVGARAEGNSVRGTLLNNGIAAVRNITLTIRSQQDNQSDTVTTVAIDNVNAWSETEFVATFNHAPGNWMIESIQVN